MFQEMSSSEKNYLFHSTRSLGKILICPFWHLMFTQDRHGTGSKKQKKKTTPNCNTEGPAWG